MTLRAMTTAACALALGVAIATAASAAELVAFDIVDESAIPQSLTGAPGDPAKGRDVVRNRRLGNCLACHAITDLASEPFHGEVGPPLDGVADRYTEAELRLQVVNAKIINPDTIMPAFYRTDGFARVLEKFQGKPVLTADQVEDVVAYLLTLKEQ